MRTRRLEIPQRVKLEVFTRAGGPENLCCEGCSLPLRGKRFDYDHIVAEGLQPLPREERVITASDVKLLGKACCHDDKTRQDVSRIAKTKRIAKAAAKAKPASRAIPGARNSPWKRKMDGTMVRRDG